MPATVSACLIVRDEEERLGDCLRSVAFCDEIVVVDSGSRDRTVQVARQAGARVVQSPWPGFAAQRNVAIDHSTGDWILEVDADERVGPALRVAIETFLAEPPPGFEIATFPRRNIFLGRPLGPAAKYPDYRHRLFRRGAYRHDEARTVHEGLQPLGPVWFLDGELEHTLANSWPEAVLDACRYARLESLQLERPSSPLSYPLGMVLRPGAKLLYRLAVDGGWRDGWRGVAKIGLDCGGDALSWAYLLAQSCGAPSGRRGLAQPSDTAEVRAGPVRLAALAAGADASTRALGWLERARAEGADVVLITDAPPPEAESIRVRALERFAPLRLIRAVDAEIQVRAVDALVPFGRRERRLARLLPRRLRGHVGGCDYRVDPVEAERRVRASARAALPPAEA